MSPPLDVGFADGEGAGERAVADGDGERAVGRGEPAVFTAVADAAGDGEIDGVARAEIGVFIPGVDESGAGFHREGSGAAVEGDGARRLRSRVDGRRLDAEVRGGFARLPRRAPRVAQGFGDVARDDEIPLGAGVQAVAAEHG